MKLGGVGLTTRVEWAFSKLCESPVDSSSIAMRWSLAREGARLAALILVSAVVVLQLVSDRGAGHSNTLEVEEDTLSLDLPSMENIR